VIGDLIFSFGGDRRSVAETHLFQQLTIELTMDGPLQRESLFFEMARFAVCARALASSRAAFSVYSRALYRRFGVTWCLTVAGIGAVLFARFFVVSNFPAMREALSIAKSAPTPIVTGLPRDFCGPPQRAST
jgi:hypothetical protein